MEFSIKNLLKVVFTLTLLPFSLFSQVIYVDSDAAGSNNGSSWTNAYTTLQSALSAANSSSEIWIAEGEYFPTSGSNKNTSFQLSNSKNGIKIYGGFIGTESSRSERDWENHATILSGNIGSSSSNSDNSYTILKTSSGITRVTIIDGLIFEKAYSSSGIRGAMKNDGSPTLQNCTFRNNEAAHGASMFNTGNAFPYIFNCRFIDNIGSEDAGGIYNYQNFESSFEPYSNNIVGFVLENCYFANNVCSGSNPDFGGAAVFNDNATGLILNTEFLSNESNGTDSYGGAILNLSRNVGSDKKFDIAVFGCSFNTNSAQTSGGAIQNTKKSGGLSGRLTILNCTFDGNEPNDINNTGTDITIQPSATVTADKELDLTAPSTICSNSNAVIVVKNSESGIEYELRDNNNNTIVGASVVGDGNDISLPIGTLSEDKSYSVWAKNTVNNNIVRLDEIVDIVVNPLPTPTLVSNIIENTICEGESLIFTASGGTNYNFMVDGISVQNSASDTYSFLSPNNGQEIYVIVENANGCSHSSEVIEISHKEKLIPTLSISGANELTCSGESVSYQAVMEEDWSSEYAFEWLLNGEVITNENSSNITITSVQEGDKLIVNAIPLSGCYATASSNLELNITGLALISDELTIQHNYGSDDIFEGDSITFSLMDIESIGISLEELDFQWYVNNLPIEGATHTSFQTNNLKNRDEIHLEVIQTSTCSERLRVAPQLTNTIAIEIQTVLERELPLQVVVYPNPTSDIVYISPKDENDIFDEVYIQIYNIQGQLLLEKSSLSPSNELAINLTSLSPNIYQMMIYAGNRKIMKKVIIQ